MWGTWAEERKEADTAVDRREETGQVRSRLPEVVTPVLQQLKRSAVSCSKLLGIFSLLPLAGLMHLVISKGKKVERWLQLWRRLGLREIGIWGRQKLVM